MPTVFATKREQFAPLAGALHQRPRRAVFLFWWACLAGLFVWLFADVLLAANNFVYRDAAHFYHPLFKYIAGQWGAGRVPLWNPSENLGTPLVAQGTFERLLSRQAAVRPADRL